MLERDIEDILEIHPYLIDSHLMKEDFQIFRQKVIKNGRMDLFLISHNSNSVYIIELKNGKLKSQDFEQLQSYYKEISSSKNLKVKGYLIGRKNESEILITDKRKSKWAIIKYLDIDIPSKVWICEDLNCRRATDIKQSFCKYCNLPR